MESVMIEEVMIEEVVMEAADADRCTVRFFCVDESLDCA